MSQAEDLLNSLAETTPQHKHPVPDSDTYFLIDPYTRQIENTNYQKTVLMRGDHNSERFTFELPRYVDGHDMSLCNRVIVHFDNIGETLDEFDEVVYTVNSDVAYTDDLRINPDKPDTVICSWLIRREATQIVGILSFSLQYLCVEDDSTVSYEWNTDSYDGIEIRKSKHNGESAIIDYTNVLEQWREQIFGAGNSVMKDITTEGANQVTAVKNESATQQAAIELKGSETLATIPDDYTEVYNMASEAVRTKGDSIVCEAEGELISVDDASDDYIRGLNLYGKSTQATTTGKNLLNVPDKINTIKGISFTVNQNRSVSVSGTPTEVCAASIYGAYGEPIAFPAGTYIISGGVDANRYIRVRIHSSDGTLISQKYADGNDKEFTINDGDLISVSIYFATLDSVNGLTFYPMIRPATVEDATYEPYTGGLAAPNPAYPQEIESIENPTVSIFGTNLFDIDSVELTTNTSLTVSDDKYTITAVGGTANIYAHSGYRLPSYLLNAIRGRTVHLAADSITTDNENSMRTCVQMNMICEDGSAQYASVREGRLAVSVNIPQNVKTVEVNIYTSNYGTKLESDVTGIFKGLRLTINENAAWESFKDAQTLQTENVLPGIPVISGGNYTDSDGQQWICDEVDLERGVYIKRIFNKTFTDFSAALNYSYDGNGTSCALAIGEQLVATMGMCSHLPLTKNATGNNRFNPIDGVIYFKLEGELTFDDLKAKLTEMSPTIIAILATPIETPLTAEEIETFKSLKTNYPNTTVLNDAGATMKIKYNADTKLYINNAAVNNAASVVEEVLNDTY